MKQKYSPAMAVLVTLFVLALSIVVVRAAGGRIEGKVTDQKGAAIVGAMVRVTDPETNQTFTATTDAQGQYKIEGLTTGTYAVVVSAKGFSEGRLDNVKVDEGVAAPGDVRLEIAPVEAEVRVNAGSSKANADPLYQQLRQQAKGDQEFAGPYATVNNLVLKRDAATFTLKSGEVYFTALVEGRPTGAVFIGEGEMTLTPPTAIEKHSLAIFIEGETLTEPFTHLVIHFTDKTFAEIKASPQAVMGTSGTQLARARDLYRENQQLLRKQLRDNAELRTLADLYAPPRPGYFNAFVGGKKHSKLLFLVDPLGIPFVSPEEVALISYGETDGGIWTAFHLADEYAKGSVSNAEDHRVVDITHHEIDATIKGVHITASDVITFRSLAAGTRVIPFNLYRSLRVSRVQDEQGKDLNFVQESKDEDADFGIIEPQALEAGRTYKLTVQYDGGDALRDSGGGNFILGPRSTWYPNNGGTQFGDRAIFDMTFHYPKGTMLVSTTAPVGAETHEGDVTVAKWSSGKTELAVAGFNYGRFKKKELADKETGYNIEFYANIDLPDELKAIQRRIEQIETSGNARTGATVTGTTLGSITTAGMADTAIGDAQNATRIYDAYFGKLPYTRIAMTQQPAANFGQAWPTLIFMPYLAFVDSTQRAQLLGTAGGGDNFWKYVAPHEVSHQWWGHIVGWDSYHDQWMSEGFAEFSASLYVQAKWGNEKFIDFWEDQRKRIVQATPRTRSLKPYTVGPVTQGGRLSNAKTGAVYQFLVYPKGAYILHMIRMMMYNAGDGGDRLFKEMMKDFIKTNFNKDVSTEDFKHIVEKHITKEMNLDGNGTMDWFFNEWVYGTEMPSYRFDYQLSGDGKTLSGRVTQSGVTANFKMLVPLYADIGKGWTKMGAARMTGNTSIEIKDLQLPQPAKRVAVCAMNDVLAASTENSK